MFSAKDKSYAGNWQIKSVEPMPQIDKDACQSAHVVESQYGLSVCFMMKAGNRFFKSLDTACDAKPGDAVNLDNVKVVILSRPGDADIMKVRI